MRDKRNIGIEILRIWMCYEVVVAHTWNGVCDNQFDVSVIRSTGVAVPVFMLISFVFSGMGKCKGRIRRLLSPHLFWALTVFLTCFIIRPKVLSFQDLGWQLLTGHSYLKQMWFLVVQVWLVLFFGLLNLLKLKRVVLSCILLLITVIAFLLQYSGINYEFFHNLRFELSYPLGRIVEMIPYATTGIIINQFGILDVIKKRWKAVIPISVLLVVLAWSLGGNFFGFGYSGFWLYFLALGLFSFFYCIPLCSISEKVKTVVLGLSRFTLGIYCMHTLVIKVVNFISGYFHVTFNMLLEALVVFSICFLIAFIMSKIKVLDEVIQ